MVHLMPDATIEHSVVDAKEIGVPQSDATPKPLEENGLQGNAKVNRDAPELLPKGALKDVSVPKEAKESKSDSKKKVKAKPLFKVRNIPGKGKGMVAARNLMPGTVILQEKPLIWMPDAIYELEDMDDIEVWLDKKINKLSSKERAAFFDLHDSRSAFGNEKTSLGIFFTNDMNFFGDAALFPTMSLINHSCKPNADFVSRKATELQEAVATRFIKRGEEITFCYLPASDEGSDVRHVRQGYLREWYGFQCTCIVCTLEDDELEENEELRKKVRDIQKAENFSQVKIADLEEFLDNLKKIGAKFPYRIDMSFEVVSQSLAANRPLQAARALTSALMMDSIVNPDNDILSDWNPDFLTAFIQRI